MKKPTMRDIGKAVGVSAVTVSRAMAGKPGMSPDMLIPFLCAMFGMCLLGFGIYRLRLRTVEQAERVESLKRRLEALDD